MPECVEIEVVREKLQLQWGSQRVKKLIVYDPLLLRQLKPVILIASDIEAIKRVGKTLYLKFQTIDQPLKIQLGMSGSLIQDNGKTSLPYPKIRLRLKTNDKDLVLVDPRRFARVYWGYLDGQKGFDILTIAAQANAAAIPAELSQILKQSQSPIKNILMNQSKILGLGNIYANEILFKAGIRPTRPSRQLKQQERQALWNACRSVLDLALKAGGSSVRNFYHPDGQRGEFQKQFKIYGKKAATPCIQCQKPIRVIRQGQRSTFYCPQCQK